MSHVVIIIQQTVAPSPDSLTETASTSIGELSAQVTYKPADSMTDAQIGNRVERIVRRLTKLADD